MDFLRNFSADHGSGIGRSPHFNLSEDNSNTSRVKKRSQSRSGILWKTQGSPGALLSCLMQPYVLPVSSAFAWVCACCMRACSTCTHYLCLVCTNLDEHQVYKIPSWRSSIDDRKLMNSNMMPARLQRFML